MNTLDTIQVLEKVEVKKRLYIVVIGADDPSDLQKPEVKEIADKEAKKAGYNVFVDKGEIRTFGQNSLAERKFFYRRKR